MKFKKMAAVALAGVTACATAPAAVPVFAADGYDHEAIENAGDITITMMISGTAYENDFETEQLPKLIKEKWPNVTLEVTKLPDDNYYTSLKTKLASGECPDIILTQPMYAGQNSCYSLAEAGYLTSLNDLDCVQEEKICHLLHMETILLQQAVMLRFLEHTTIKNCLHRQELTVSHRHGMNSWKTARNFRMPESSRS